MKQSKIREIKSDEKYFSSQPILKTLFTSVSRLALALALFILAAISISGAGIVIEDGMLGVNSTGPSHVLEVTRGARIGTNFGSLTAIPRGNANILLYDAGDTNWAGLGADGSGNVWFKTGTSGTPDARLVIDNAGNVGIGITTPTKKLHVNGDVNLTGTIYNPYVTLSGSTSYGNIAAYGERSLYFTAGSNFLWINRTNYVEMSSGGSNEFRIVNGNANVTGELAYGSLKANSPVLKRTTDPFVAECTTADDGSFIVEYIHEDAGNYASVIEKVDPDSGNWWHRQCYEKNEKFSFLDANLVCGEYEHECTIDEIGFDCETRSAYTIG